MSPEAPQEASPALIEALQDTDWGVRVAAATALGEIGPAAKAARPALEKALLDADKRVRESAREALNGIEGNPKKQQDP